MPTTVYTDDVESCYVDSEAIVDELWDEPNAAVDRLAWVLMLSRIPVLVTVVSEEPWTSAPSSTR